MRLDRRTTYILTCATAAAMATTRLTMLSTTPARQKPNKIITLATPRMIATTSHSPYAINPETLALLSCTIRLPNHPMALDHN